jgi:hypothetical protein
VPRRQRFLHGRRLRHGAAAAARAAARRPARSGGVRGASGAAARGAAVARLRAAAERKDALLHGVMRAAALPLAVGLRRVRQRRGGRAHVQAAPRP